MGLDSYWKVQKRNGEWVENKKVKWPEGTQIQLCGGLFSGCGPDSFRGKVYSALIEQVTGVSLYQETIPNLVVKDMADKLSELGAEALSKMSDGYYFPDGMPLKEAQDLILMFRIHADAGSCLLGWW